jgi:7-alpha-hydroxysteroid dehydrogenase
VLTSARNRGQLARVAGAVSEAGRRAVAEPADARDTDALAGLAEAAYDEFGRLDVVVNNVGGTVPNTLLDTDVAHLEDAFRFNVGTAHALTRAAVPLMLRDAGDPDRQKSVVAISSVMARTAARGYLAYGTAKATLSHWTRLAATDLSPRIRVNGSRWGRC